MKQFAKIDIIFKNNFQYSRDVKDQCILSNYLSQFQQKWKGGKLFRKFISAIRKSGGVDYVIPSKQTLCLG